MLHRRTLNFTRRHAAGHCRPWEFCAGEELTAAPPAGWGEKWKESLQRRWKRVTTLVWITRFWQNKVATLRFSEPSYAAMDQRGYAKKKKKYWRRFLVGESRSTAISFCFRLFSRYSSEIDFRVQQFPTCIFSFLRSCPYVAGFYVTLQRVSNR